MARVGVAILVDQQVGHPVRLDRALNRNGIGIDVGFGVARPFCPRDFERLTTSLPEDFARLAAKDRARAVRVGGDPVAGRVEVAIGGRGARVYGPYRACGRNTAPTRPGPDRPPTIGAGLAVVATTLFVF